jgi:lipopolysaccharide transport system ATP-binding protein
MHDKIILRVNNLGKCFKIYSNPWQRALEWAIPGKRTYHQPFWALQNISFEVQRGEFLGIIGQNGAGKSTLLKILSGVLQPTTGTYHIQGRVLSMLELGRDFSPYLTGRENAIRNTELLGFPDGYVQERMEQIAQFSELGEFFDRPVGLYSTGMSARLAFSLYAFLDCEVLILDEVLAVGDLFFRQKCYARLEELMTDKITIIIVTHNMGTVRHYCDHVIVLNKGQKIYEGESQKAIYLFHQLRYDRADILPETVPQEELPEDSLSVNNKIFWPAEHVFTLVSYLSSTLSRLTRFAICNQR